MTGLVCDTGPVNYLIQIESVHLLPALFQTGFPQTNARIAPELYELILRRNGLHT
jgi:hypothetical protein